MNSFEIDLRNQFNGAVLVSCDDAGLEGVVVETGDDLVEIAGLLAVAGLDVPEFELSVAAREAFVGVVQEGD